MIDGEISLIIMSNSEISGLPVDFKMIVWLLAQQSSVHTSALVLAIEVVIEVY